MANIVKIGAGAAATNADLYVTTGIEAGSSIALDGATSGTVTISVQPIAGSYTFGLPQIGGSTGDFLTSAGGSGPMTWTAIAGTANRISISGSTINISPSYVGQSTITTLGTVTAGTWNATAIANANLANSAMTIAGTSTSLGGSITLDAITGVSSNGLIKRSGANTLTVATAGSDYENPLTFSTGLTRSTNTVTVNTSQNIATLSNLTSNGFIKTSGGTGALSVDTSTYLTANQTITLSGDISGSGTTAITATVGSGKITNAMLAGSIANAKLSNSSLTIAATSVSLGGTITLDTILGLSSGAGFVKRSSANTYTVDTTTYQGHTASLDDFSSLADSNALVVFGNTGTVTTLAYSLDAATYLDGSGNWTTPSGGGGTVTQVEDGSSNVILDGTTGLLYQSTQVAIDLPDAILNDLSAAPSVQYDSRILQGLSSYSAGWGEDPVDSHSGMWIICGTGDSRSLTLVDVNAGGGGSAGTIKIQCNHGGQYITFDNPTTIKNVTDPVDQQDVATKNYVDYATATTAISRQATDYDVTSNTINMDAFSGIPNSDVVVYCSTSDSSDIEHIITPQFDGQILWLRPTRGGLGADPSPNSVLESGNIRMYGGTNASTIFGTDGQLGLMYNDASGHWLEISRKEYDS